MQQLFMFDLGQSGKVCASCGNFFKMSDFHKGNKGKHGLVSTCKKCCRSYQKKYYAIKENREKHALSVRKRYDRLKQDKNEAEKKMIYRLNNRDRDSLMAKARNSSPCYSSKRCKNLPCTDKARLILGIVTVICKNCGKRFVPTYSAITARISAISGKMSGESNLYCSGKCKSSCPIYHFNTSKQVDPRSKKYIPKTEQQKARSCQTDHLKQKQCDETCGQSYCEKCGDFIDVELHHTLEIAKHGKDAINSAGHILLCAGCHAELHGRCI